MNRVKRLALALAVVLGVGMAGAIITESPAYAAYENCQQLERLCTYTGFTGGGTLYYYTGPQDTCINIGGGLNDTMSSVKNNFSVFVTLYRDANCVNTFWKVGLGKLPCSCHKYDNLANIAMNDVLSSIWIGNNPPN